MNLAPDSSNSPEGVVEVTHQRESLFGSEGIPEGLWIQVLKYSKQMPKSKWTFIHKIGNRQEWGYIKLIFKLKCDDIDVHTVIKLSTRNINKIINFKNCIECNHYSHGNNKKCCRLWSYRRNNNNIGYFTKQLEHHTSTDFKFYINEEKRKELIKFLDNVIKKIKEK